MTCTLTADGQPMRLYLDGQDITNKVRKVVLEFPGNADASQVLYVTVHRVREPCVVTVTGEGAAEKVLKEVAG